MNSNKIEELANRIIPSDLRQIVRSLNSELDWAIISVLEETELNFSGLKEKLEVEDNKILTYHLKKLSKNALIQHYYKHSNFEQNYSYYVTSKLGEKLISNIKDVFNINNYNLAFVAHPILNHPELYTSTSYNDNEAFTYSIVNTAIPSALYSTSFMHKSHFTDSVSFLSSFSSSAMETRSPIIRVVNANDSMTKARVKL